MGGVKKTLKRVEIFVCWGAAAPVAPSAAPLPLPPAQAGTQGQTLRTKLQEIPAFAGMTGVAAVARGMTKETERRVLEANSTTKAK